MILSKLFGTKSEREIKKLSSEVDKINHSYKLKGFYKLKSHF